MSDMPEDCMTIQPIEELRHIESFVEAMRTLVRYDMVAMPDPLMIGVGLDYFHRALGDYRFRLAERDPRCGVNVYTDRTPEIVVLHKRNIRHCPCSRSFHMQKMTLSCIAIFKLENTKKCYFIGLHLLYTTNLPDEVKCVALEMLHATNLSMVQ